MTINDEDILEQLERRWVTALVQRDASELGEIWDQAFVFTDPEGKVMSREQCLAELAAGKLAIEDAQVLRLKVQVFGETGVVLGIIALRGRSGKTKYDGEYSFMDVFAKRDGRWRAVLSSGDRAQTLLSDFDATGEGG